MLVQAITAFGLKTWHDCRPCIMLRIISSILAAPYTELDASDTSLTQRTTACVWYVYGNRVWRCTTNVPSKSSVGMFIVRGGSWHPLCHEIIAVYVSASKLSVGIWNFRNPLGVSRYFAIRRHASSRICDWLSYNISNSTFSLCAKKAFLWIVRWKIILQSGERYLE